MKRRGTRNQQCILGHANVCHSVVEDKVKKYEKKQLVTEVTNEWPSFSPKRRNSCWQSSQDAEGWVPFIGRVVTQARVRGEKEVRKVLATVFLPHIGHACLCAPEASMYINFPTEIKGYHTSENAPGTSLFFTYVPACMTTVHTKVWNIKRTPQGFLSTILISMCMHQA